MSNPHLKNPTRRAEALFIPGGRGFRRTKAKLGRSLALPLEPLAGSFQPADRPNSEVAELPSVACSIELSIVPLAAHPEWVEIVAQWLLDLWPEAFHHRISIAQKKVRERCQINQRPMTLIACVAGVPVGTVSLSEDNAPPNWSEIETRVPVLSGLFVLPQWRGHRIGNRLCGEAILVARQLGCIPLFLFTLQPDYYQRMGWQMWDADSGCLWLGATSSIAPHLDGNQRQHP